VRAGVILPLAMTVYGTLVVPGRVEGAPQCGGEASAKPTAIHAGASCAPASQSPQSNAPEDPRSVRGQGAGLVTHCTHTPGPDYTPDFGAADIGNFRVQEGVVQMQWVRHCPGRQDVWYWQSINGTPEAPGPPIVTPQDLIPGAFDSVERQLPTPVPVIAPADRNATGFAYVQNRTFFWVEQAPGQWAPVSASASVPGLSVTVTAVPERFTVDTGDGSTVDCPGAPPALAPNSSPAGFDGCGHVYRDSSAMAPNGATFPVTVTIVWHATWQASNGTSGDLGRLSTTSTPRDLPVAEIQAVVTQG
jgi:hypothetical protein